MPTITATALGAPCWIDLASSDLDRAKDFYGGIFGWTFESAGAEYGGYTTARKDGRKVAGLMANDPQWQMPDAWSTYLHTADIDATLAKAVAAGGFSCGGAMDIPEQGRMAMLTDPDEAMFGLWQPTGHRGFEVVGEPGAPVWHQLTTRNYGVALEFYRQLLGWQTQTESDTDEFRYATAVFDGEALLGVMDGSVLPAGTPAQWSFFLGAEDVDTTVEAVLARGGSVLRAAEDTPYGRLAAVADPTGAAFNLSSLPTG
ncbi:VOC family protein [[Mycobacterium] wendilense]|uniref:VOC family protein n=1 Tax=[Mycobacterium] wendilense TaxID=3064284 RepID=A0ABN9P1H5_9MYCO|nr:VOC family protein [Mycolicibacterium sp. MU0050]CAJ1579996.1 VOC family protein [Mycolicibacterium sp. MU0050]